ncbi:hypothetical protein PanWU01x14_368110 [Parasponia andersonii]|uniref:KIB1-4 beta-propeller domain-containing protein n=1 Tax=Parasponia andersonii TaxID=3476 RepID=A0A2P5A553_PARAD|nr:hypothetical protein PanWU01x14_368110 [Parasponia andersonii]
MTTFTPNQVAIPNDLIVVVIYGHPRVAFIRPARDSTWTSIIDDNYDDIVYYKDQFYAITTQHTGILVSFDVTNSSKSNVIVTEEIFSHNEEGVEEQEDDDDDEEEEIFSYNEEEEDEGFLYRVYLVESIGGDLLKVKRWQNYDNYRVTRSFTVFKLGLADVPRWLKVDSLGDEALFLGDNSSIYVLASNFGGCQKNCIYFTDDKTESSLHNHGPWDLGIFNLETGVCERGLNIDGAIIAKMDGRIPIWIVPTLNI